MAHDGARRVLVVEEDLSVRGPLVKFLQLRGFETVTAKSADEGLEALRNHRFVAAVVELRLSEGSGREVVVAAPPDVPVIIFSSASSDSEELELVRPRTRLIEKPYSLILLIETLEEMLSDQSSQDLHP